MSLKYMPLGTLLRKCTPPAGAKAAVVKEHAEFLKRSDELQKFKENVARQRGNLEQAMDDPGSFNVEGGSSGSIGFDAMALKDLELQVLSDELKIRVDLPPYIGRFSAAMSDAVAAAEKALKDFESQLTAKLIGIGYHDPIKQPLSCNRVINDFLFRHPQRFALFEAARILRDEQNNLRPRIENETAITHIRAAIRESGRRFAGMPAMT